MNSVIKRFFMAVIGCAMASLPLTALASEDLGNIMPLGDSITSGYPVAGGYRDPLYTSLTNGGYTFNFVGSATNNASTLLTKKSQVHHEGHGGYVIIGNGKTTNGLDENLNSWIGSSGAAPDRILLMIGTNCLTTSASTLTAANDLNTLIGHIYTYRPSVNLYVASTTPRTDIEAWIKAYNSQIPGIVAAYAGKGKTIHYVNMHDALDASTDLYDEVHPKSSGYAKMADVWYSALTTNTPEPGSFVLLVSGALCAGAYAWRRRTQLSNSRTT